MLDLSWVAKFARGPTETTVARAKSLHENVRALLGEVDYDTLLQGSYRTGTALADMNDVDILAIKQGADLGALRSGKSQAWATLFGEVEKRLDANPSYAGKWNRGDKCIRLETGVHIDIVPAVSCGESGTDPIAIYSLGAKKVRKNWPRGHYDNAASKNAATNGNFKPAVRLFKRWATCQFGDKKTAPSYYIQCLLYSLPDSIFTGDLAQDFVTIAKVILDRHGVPGGYSFRRLPRIAGEGDLFTPSEWDGNAFESFEAGLRASLPFAERALAEQEADRARAAWRMAFAGFDG